MKPLQNLLVFLIVSFVASGLAQDNEDRYTLITNVNIFDGTSAQLTMNQNVLIKNNLIDQIGANVQTPRGAAIPTKRLAFFVLLVLAKASSPGRAIETPAAFRKQRRSIRISP